MKAKIKKAIDDKIESLIKDSFDELLLEHLDVSNAIGCMDDDDKIQHDRVRDAVGQHINDYDIVYHSDAMKYLSDNDPSLVESFGIASELSTETENLNSSTLATLHIQNKMHELNHDCCDKFYSELSECLNNQEQVHTIIDDIESYIDDIYVDISDADTTVGEITGYYDINYINDSISESIDLLSGMGDSEIKNIYNVQIEKLTRKLNRIIGIFNGES